MSENCVVCCYVMRCNAVTVTATDSDSPGDVGLVQREEGDEGGHQVWTQDANLTLQ